MYNCIKKLTMDRHVTVKIVYVFLSESPFVLCIMCEPCLESLAGLVNWPGGSLESLAGLVNWPGGTYHTDSY